MKKKKNNNISNQKKTLAIALAKKKKKNPLLRFEQVRVKAMKFHSKTHPHTYTLQQPPR